MTDWEVLEGDSLEKVGGLEGASFRAIVTDPPYSSGARGENEKLVGNCSMQRTVDPEDWFNGDSMTVESYTWFLRECALEWNRLLEIGGSVLIFTDWRMMGYVKQALESVGLSMHNCIVWDKGSFGMGKGFRYQHEFILHFTKGKFDAEVLDTGNVLRHKRTDNDDHPTQKPVPLLEELLRVVASRGGRILDPFAGSGSTGVAAVQLGMGFTGIERDAEHAETARNRLSGAGRQARITSPVE